MASLCHIPKGKFVSKNYIKTATWNIVPGPFVFAKNYAQPLLENDIFEATCLYDICNSKNIKICQNHHAHLLRFLFTGDSFKLKELGTSFQAIFFIKFFDQNLSFVILHKLTKFHYQTVFTFQVIQQNVFHVSCLGVWWRHDIWISEKKNFDYLKNEKSFRSEIKNIFTFSQVLCFRLTKQTSKNVVDTAFESWILNKHPSALISY